MEPISAPPPPPPPPPCVTQHHKKSPLPRPAHAAIPFHGSRPVQETSPSEAQLDAPATPPPPVDNGPAFPASEGPEDNLYDSGEKSGPVQETEPAPQTSPGPQITEPGVEDAVHMDPAAED